jgi:hypothetical protein
MFRIKGITKCGDEQDIYLLPRTQRFIVQGEAFDKEYFS